MAARIVIEVIVDYEADTESAMVKGARELEKQVMMEKYKLPLSMRGRVGIRVKPAQMIGPGMEVSEHV